MCNLCLAEKLEIIKADKKRSLNKRTELVSKCRHENRFYLCNFPPAVPWTGSPTFSDFPTLYFADFSNCRFFDTFELFELLPAFSWSCRCFSNFSSFFLCIITRSSSFFDDPLGFIIFYGFSFFLSSPNFMLVLSLPPCFSTLYLPANFCQFFRAQVVLRTTPFLSRPIRTTLLSKVLSFLVH